MIHDFKKVLAKKRFTAGNIEHRKTSRKILRNLVKKPDKHLGRQFLTWHVSAAAAAMDAVFVAPKRQLKEQEPQLVVLPYLLTQLRCLFHLRRLFAVNQFLLVHFSTLPCIRSVQSISYVFPPLLYVL